MNEAKFYWNETKSWRLKFVRGAGFRDLVLGGQILMIRNHPVREGQRLILVHYQNYVWVIPCVPHKDGFFLKTLYPSRKATWLFREGKLNEED